MSWRSLPEAPGYEISDDGEVRSYWSRGRRPQLQTEPHLLVPNLDSLGYQHVRISVNHKSRDRKVHHLVLEAFSGPCPAGMECRHLDGNPSNNRRDNLVWGTRDENLDDRERHGSNSRCGTKGEKHRSAKLGEQQVREIMSLRNRGAGIKEIAVLYGVHNSVISRIANRRIWRHLHTD